MKKWFTSKRLWLAVVTFGLSIATGGNAAQATEAAAKSLPSTEIQMQLVAVAIAATKIYDEAKKK